MKRCFTNAGFLAVSIITFLIASLFAVNTIAQDVARFRNGDLGIGTWGRVLGNNDLGSKTWERGQWAGKYYLLIHFSELPTEQEHVDLLKSGIELLEYIPDNFYFASISKDFITDKLIKLGIDYIDTIPIMHKADISLQTGEIPSYAQRGNLVEVNIHYFRNINSESILPLLNENGIGLIESYPEFYKLKCLISISDIERISKLPWLMWIEPAAPAKKANNREGKASHRSNYIQTPFTAGRYLRGDSVKVGIWDAGKIGTHIDLQNRVTNVQDVAEDSHSSHCAGTICGAGNKEALAEGMAPRALLYSWDYNGDIPSEMSSGVSNQSIVITSNSYGYSEQNPCNSRGVYDSESRGLDMLVRSRTYLTHVFSAGNEASDCSGGWGTVGDGSQSAKNILAVAAIQDNDQVATFSSKGPVRDGRLKPEISAVGVSVYSTQNGNQYTSMNGTSMACPGVAGTVAQIYQSFKRKNTSQNPNSSLIRAIVCNTADDIGNSGPDYTFGFGKINALRAVETIENSRYIVDSVNNSSSKTFNITVPSNTLRVKVTLAWNDKEAAVNANPALVNNLDLTLITPSSVSYNPWKLVPSNPSAAATRGIDSLNNIEQVTLDNPSSGTYKIWVRGLSVAYAPQVFAVAYDFVTTEVLVTFPRGGESIKPGRAEYIRWYGEGLTNTINVELSTNNGNSWSTIASSLAATQRYYQWTPTTSQIAGKAKIRVTSGSLSSSSDTFTILDSPSDFQAEHRGTRGILTWSAISGASSYDVLKLDSLDWTLLANVTSTSYTVTDVGSDSEIWVSVRAKTSDGGLGERANAQKIRSLVNLSNYSFLQTTGAFTAFTDGTTGPTGDDEGSTVTLPFTFVYGGREYSQIRICTNGWAQLAGDSDVDYDNVLNRKSNFLCPLWDDLEIDASASIKYKTTGSSPNRVFHIQWRNAKKINTSARLNFQISIYENSKKIEFIYGTMSSVSDMNASIGVSGPEGGTNNFISVTPGISVSVSSDSDNNSVNNTQVAMLANNVMYVFEPQVFVPSLLSPANDSVGASVSPAFAWDAVDEATSYHFQLSLNENFTSTVVNQSGITSTTYTASSLSNNTVYYWRVRAFKTGDTSEWSGEWRFRTIGAIATPQLSSPANEAAGLSIPAALAWNSVGLASAYHLQVSQYNTFASLLINQTGITSTSYSLSSLTGGNTYYWRVRCYAGADTSNYSSIWQFTTQLSSPEPLNPANNSTGVSTTPNLAWDRVTGATGYQAMLSKYSDFQTVVLDTANITDTTFVAPNLTSITRYYWKVRAFSASDTSDYSDTFNFTTTTKVSDYTFSSYAANYTENTSGTVYGDANTDDDNYSNINIGFPFVFNSSTYTQVGINSNGFIFFGSTPISSYYSNAMTNSETSNIAAALSRDLAAASNSELRVTRSGNSPNRIFTIQFKNFKNYGITGDSYNFQFKLYETTNVIEFVYGNFTTSANSLTTAVGLKGLSNSDYNNRSVTSNVNTWSTSSKGTALNNLCDLNSNLKPASGLVFKWTPRQQIMPPVLLSPASDSARVALNPVLLWEAAENAQSYHLQVSASSTFSSLLVNEISLTSTSYSLTDLSYFTNYWWRLRSIDGGDTSEWSSSRKFTTIPRPITPPALSYPANNGTGIALNTSFSWTAVDSATTYIIEISTTEDFSNIIDSQSGLSSTTFTSSDLSSYKTYYWRVRAVGQNDTSAWSDTRSFTTISVFTLLSSGLSPVGYSSTAFGDYDNDGRLDILLSGLDSTGTNISKLYRNSGNGSYSLTNANLTGASTGTSLWTDYNNDGWLDILISGNNTSSGYITKLYRNESGSGSFTEINANLQAAGYSSVACADYNNDGSLDIVITGRNATTYFTKLYRNNSGSFTEVSAGFANLSAGSAAWADYNNDGWIDLLITGIEQSSDVRTYLYQNSSSGTFSAVTTNLPRVYFSSTDWGDFDNDGDLDVLISGLDNSLTNITKIYRNDGSGVFTDINAGLRGVRYSSVKWGDFDSDGKLDAMVTGFYGSVRIAKIYKNYGDGVFTEYNTGFQEVYSNPSSIAFGDIDNDSDLDALITGYSEYPTPAAKLYRNDLNIANTAPTAPSGLTETVSGTSVTFSWSETTDSQTSQDGLSYNLRFGTSSNKNSIISPLSNVTTSFRKVPALGNVNQTNRHVINNIPSGTYYWSVQAVDNGFKGSSFATERSITIGFPTPSLVSPVNESANNSTTLTLNWSSVSIATSYQVQIAVDSLFSTITVNQTGLTTTSYLTTALSAGTRYFWRVRGRTSNDSSSWSSVWSFRTANATPQNDAPTRQARSIFFSSVQSTSLRTLYFRGNGDSVMVIAAAGNEITALPQDNTIYNSNAAFGSGSNLGGSPATYVLYKGTGFGLTVTNLSPETEYTFKVIEFNTDSTGGGHSYQTKDTTGNPRSRVTAAGPPVILGVSGKTDESFDTRWRYSYDADYFELCVSLYPDFSENLQDYDFADIGADTSFSIWWLEPDTKYYYRVRAVNGNIASVWSNTDSVRTYAAEPTSAPIGLTINSTGSNALRLNWQKGSGSAKTLILAYTSDPTTLSADNIGYAADSSYTSSQSSSLGSAKVVYNGTGTEINVINLNTSSTYYFRLYSYNGTGTTSTSGDNSQTNGFNYLTSSYAAGSSATSIVEPTLAPSAITFTNVTSSGLSMAWTPGNGSYHIVLAKTTSGFSAPVDANTYTGNSNYTATSSTIGGAKVLFAGSGSSLNVTGLSANTRYYFAVYTFNGSGGAENYLSTSALKDTTTRSNSATKIVITSITSPIVSGQSFTMTIQTQNDSGTPVSPAANTTISVGRIGSGTLSGTISGTILSSQTSATISGIVYSNAAGETGVRFIATDGSSGMRDDTTSGQIVRAVEPTLAPSSLTFPSPGATSLTLNWNVGNGSRYIVLAKATTGFTAPTDGVTYTANASFQSTASSTIGGAKVVYLGTNNSTTVTGLSANTSYYFAVYTLNGTESGTENYLATALTGTGTTMQVATKIKITSFPTAIVSGQPFNVTLQTQDDSGTPVSPSSNLTIFISRIGSGTLSGTLSGSITTSQTQVTISGVIYTNANGETGVRFTATDGTAGLRDDTTSSMNIQASEPTTAPSSMTFSNIGSTSVTVNWTSGNGSRHILLAKATSGFTSPTDLTTYTANSDYQSTASSTISGAKVVYAGTGNSATITGLSAGTTYYFAVYTYNGAYSGVENYLSTSATGNVTTSTSSVATKLVITQISSPIVSGGSFSVTVQTQDNSGNAISPSSNLSISIGKIGNGTLSGTTTGSISTSQTQTTISGIVYTRNSGESGVKFTASDGSAGLRDDTTSSKSIIAAEPTQVDNLRNTGRSRYSLSIEWDEGGSGKRIIVGKIGNETIVAGDMPSDGRSYTANNDFSAADTVGSNGAKVVYNGTGTSITVNGLERFTYYTFAALEYAGLSTDDATLNYNTNLSADNINSRQTMRKENVIDTENSSIQGVVISEVYPNPVENIISLNITLPESARVVVKMLDLTGREVSVLMSERVLNQGENKLQLEIDRNLIPSGMYNILIILNDNTTYIRKTIIEK